MSQSPDFVPELDRLRAELDEHLDAIERHELAAGIPTAEYTELTQLRLAVLRLGMHRTALDHRKEDLMADYQREHLERLLSPAHLARLHAGRQPAAATAEGGSDASGQ